MVSLYHTECGGESQRSRRIENDLLRDYVGYARASVKTNLTEEARLQLIQYYLDMRKVGAGKGSVCAYPRQLESLIRLSEAHAKGIFSFDCEMFYHKTVWSRPYGVYMSELHAYF